MATNFPAALDTTTNLPNPIGTDLLDNANDNLDHDRQHSTVNDALAAIESALGTSTTTVQNTITWRLRHAPNAPTVSTSYDDEFDSTSLDTSKWTLYQQAISTSYILSTSLANGSLIMRVPVGYQGNKAVRSITQAAPSGDWIFETCVRQYGAYITNQAGSNVPVYTGLILSSSGNTNHIMWGKMMDNVVGRWGILSCVKLNSVGDVNSTYRAANVVPFEKVYLRVQRSGSNLFFHWSLDGHNFEVWTTTTDTNFLTGGTSRVGVAVAHGNFTGVPDLIATVEYFRRIA